MPRTRILIFAAACIVIAAALAITTMVVTGKRDAAGPMVVSSGKPDVGGPFQLVNQDGQAVDQSMLNGKWSLVFFGFTYCPDFCPTTLTMLDETQKRLGDKAKDVQIVFVSIDPARDTPQAMKDYLSDASFPDGVIGLTGTEAQVAAAAKAYRVFYKKSGEGEGYTMDHSLTIYLMDPDGQFATALTSDLGPERSAQVIERAMARR